MRLQSERRVNDVRFFVGEAVVNVVALSPSRDSGATEVVGQSCAQHWSPTMRCLSFQGSDICLRHWYVVGGGVGQCSHAIARAWVELRRPTIVCVFDPLSNPAPRRSQNRSTFTQSEGLEEQFPPTRLVSLSARHPHTESP